MTRDVRLLLTAILFAYWIQVGVVILAPLKAVALGESAAMAAALVAVWGLLAVVLDLPVSAISDGRGRRPMVIAGGLAMAASAITLGLAPGYAGLVVGVVLFSVGQALAIGPLLALLTETTADADQRRVQGVNGFVQAVSSVVAAMAAGLLAQLGFDVAFVPLLAAAGIVVTSAALTRESPTERERAGRARVAGAHVRALRLAAGQPAVLFAALGVVLFAITFTVVASTILPIVLVDFAGYAPATAGLLLACRNLVAAGVALSFARTTRRWGVPAAVIRTGLVGVIGTALLAVTLGEPVLLLGALVLQGIGVAFSAPAANILVTESTVPGERAVGISALTVASRATVLVVPLVLAPFLVRDAGGLVFVVAAGLGAIVLALMVRTSRRIPVHIGRSHRDVPERVARTAGAEAA